MEERETGGENFIVSIGGTIKMRARPGCGTPGIPLVIERLFSPSRRAIREYCRVYAQHGTHRPALIRSSLGGRKKCRGQNRVGLSIIDYRGYQSLRDINSVRIYFSVSHPTRGRSLPGAFCCCEKSVQQRKQENRRGAVSISHDVKLSATRNSAAISLRFLSGTR